MNKLPFLVFALALVGVGLFGTGTFAPTALEIDEPALAVGVTTTAEESLVLASTPEISLADVLAPSTDRTPVASPLHEPIEPDAPSAELVELRREVGRLQKRIDWLETELDLCGSEVTQGPVGRWLAALRPEERPDAKTLRMVSAYLKPYPVELSAAEGLWVAERIRLDDWKTHAATIDEALVLFLGPARLAAELPKDQVAALREDWSEEGFFQ